MNAFSKEHAPGQEHGQNRPLEVQLKVSRYDQVASMLVSMLILVGVSVMLLVIVWLTNTLVLRQPKLKITGAGLQHNSNDAAGFEQAMATPGLDELPELMDPQFAAALQAVTDATSSVLASPIALVAPQPRRVGAKAWMTPIQLDPDPAVLMWTDQTSTRFRGANVGRYAGRRMGCILTSANWSFSISNSGPPVENVPWITCSI